MKSLKIILIFTLIFLTSPSLVQAKKNPKLLLDTSIDLTKPLGQAVQHQKNNLKSQDRWTYGLQSWLMFYAYSMHQLPASSRLRLLNEVQAYVGAVATDQGLQRPKLLSGSAFAKNPPTAQCSQAFVLHFASEAKQGHSLTVSPEAQQIDCLPLAVLSLLQDMVDRAPSEALRLGVISMGAINKWYRDPNNRAEDIKSLSQAPAYALNLAVDILSKLSGKNF